MKISLLISICLGAITNAFIQDFIYQKDKTIQKGKIWEVTGFGLMSHLFVKIAIKWNSYYCLVERVDFENQQNDNLYLWLSKVIMRSESYFGQLCRRIKFICW